MKIELTPQEAADLIDALRGRFDSDEFKSALDAYMHDAHIVAMAPLEEQVEMFRRLGKL
jgi:hypothetical protein